MAFLSAKKCRGEREDKAGWSKAKIVWPFAKKTPHPPGAPSRVDALRHCQACRRSAIIVFARESPRIGTRRCKCILKQRSKGETSESNPRGRAARIIITRPGALVVRHSNPDHGFLRRLRRGRERRGRSGRRSQAKLTKVSAFSGACFDKAVTARIEQLPEAISVGFLDVREGKVP